jgi:hypothetical protein
MVIRELNTDAKFATVTLSYDEIRCLSNSLYQLSKVEEKDKEFDLQLMNAKMLELFSLIKHGMLPEFELGIIHDLIYKYNEENKERK